MSILSGEELAHAGEVSDRRREEFGHLCEEYEGAVSYFFARRGFPPEDCRDLMQETFLNAYRGLSRFRDDAELKTWLLRIAANVWKNALRSRQAVKRSAMRTVPLEGVLSEGDRASDPSELDPSELDPSSIDPAARLLGGSDVPTLDPLDRVLRDESKRMLRDAVAGLPPRMRRCVQLRIDRSLKYREIAAILQVSVDTVKSQLHQAREELRRELDKYFDGAGA